MLVSDLSPSEALEVMTSLATSTLRTAEHQLDDSTAQCLIAEIIQCLAAEVGLDVDQFSVTEHVPSGCDHNVILADQNAFTEATGIPCCVLRAHAGSTMGSGTHCIQISSSCALMTPAYTPQDAIPTEQTGSHTSTPPVQVYHSGTVGALVSVLRSKIFKPYSAGIYTMVSYDARDLGEFQSTEHTFARLLKGHPASTNTPLSLVGVWDVQTYTATVWKEKSGRSPIRTSRCDSCAPQGLLLLASRIRSFSSSWTPSELGADAPWVTSVANVKFASLVRVTDELEAALRTLRYEPTVNEVRDLDHSLQPSTDAVVPAQALSQEDILKAKLGSGSKPSDPSGASPAGSLGPIRPLKVGTSRPPSFSGEGYKASSQRSRTPTVAKARGTVASAPACAEVEPPHKPKIQPLPKTTVSPQATAQPSTKKAAGAHGQPQSSAGQKKGAIPLDDSDSDGDWGIWGTRWATADRVLLDTSVMDWVVQNQQHTDLWQLHGSSLYLLPLLETLHGLRIVLAYESGKGWRKTPKQIATLLDPVSGSAKLGDVYTNPDELQSVLRAVQGPYKPLMALPDFETLLPPGVTEDLPPPEEASQPGRAPQLLQEIQHVDQQIVILHNKRRKLVKDLAALIPGAVEQ